MAMKRFGIATLVLLAWISVASAQCSGNFAAGEVCGNSSTVIAPPSHRSLSLMFDRAFCGTNGNGVIRLAGTWVCAGSTGTGSFVLATSPTIATSMGVGMAPSGNYLLELQKANSHIHLSFDGADTGGYIASVNANNIAFSGGSTFNGTLWVAKSTSATIFNAFSGTAHFFNDTGLTPGSTYTPTERLFVGIGVSVGDATDPGTNGALRVTSFIHAGTKIRAAGTAPGLTSCGTSPAISGSDLAGEVTMGTGTPTGCVITFNVAYAATPYCVVTWQANLAAMGYTVSTAALTTTQTATSSNKINYICMARSGG